MNNLIKNPILIGFIIATGTYIYLKWKTDKKNKKHKTNKEVNLLIPLIAGIITSILAYYYFNEQQYISPPIQIPLQTIPKISETLDDSLKSFRLIGRGVNLPKNLIGDFPDI